MVRLQVVAQRKAGVVARPTQPPRTQKPGEQSNPPGFSFGALLGALSAASHAEWERAEQKRRYNNLCPLTVPFLP
jgi:hypothetical protein